MNCSIVDFAGVVQAVKEKKLNATNFVAECEESCIIMFGTGNPDISGRGVMIAYIWQVALTCIFGPILPIVVWLLRARTSRRIILMKRALAALKKIVYEINAFYTISLLVASVVRYKQTPSILEVYFMVSLTQLQVQILLSMVAALFCDWFLNLSKFSIRWLIYNAAMGVGQGFLAYSINLPRSAFPVYYEAAKACHQLRKVPDFSWLFRPSSNSSSTLKWLLIGLGTGLAAGFIVFFLGRFLTWIGRGLAFVWHGIRWLARKVIPVWIRENAQSLYWIFILLIWVANLIIATRDLLRTRNLIKRVSGDRFHDDEWGYGQTTAVLLWMPFCWRMLTETIKFFWRLYRNQPLPEAEELQPLAQSGAAQAGTNAAQTAVEPNGPPEESDAAPPPYAAIPPPPPPSSPAAQYPQHLQHTDTSITTSADLGEQPIPQGLRRRSTEFSDAPEPGIVHRDTEARIGVDPPLGSARAARFQVQRTSSLRLEPESMDPATDGLRRRGTAE